MLIAISNPPEKIREADFFVYDKRPRMRLGMCYVGTCGMYTQQWDPISKRRAKNLRHHSSRSKKES
jgi:homospermidine synthase